MTLLLIFILVSSHSHHHPVYPHRPRAQKHIPEPKKKVEPQWKPNHGPPATPYIPPEDDTPYQPGNMNSAYGLLDAGFETWYNRHTGPFIRDSTSDLPSVETDSMSFESDISGGETRKCVTKAQ